uniref:Major capsid protein n=1 Tax=Pseudomonas phage Pavpe01 TaxID=3138545 RepID=A0AAU6W0S0_9VIRU
MALSDLAVYSEYAYLAMTETIAQQIELFNAASGGTIVLVPAAHQGDFSDEAFFAKISGLVRRRNSYGTGAISQKTLKHLVDTSVKVAAGTSEVRLDPGQFRWIQLNPEVAGAAMGQQLAGDLLADMLNTAIGCGVSALSQTTEVVKDVTAATAPADVPSFVNMAQAAGLFGDRQNAIRAWIMHSTPITGLFVNALTNAEKLFTYETVNVIRDPFGRLYVVTDSPSLQFTGSPGGFYSLGLTQGGLYVGQNNDFDAAETVATGDENIKRTYQAEWSYNVGVQGYSWDKPNGGKSPTDAALFTASNWDKYSTSHKDLAGVLLKSH